MAHRASAYTVGSQYSQLSPPDSSNPLPFSANSTASHQGSAFTHPEAAEDRFGPPAHIPQAFDPNPGRHSESQFYEALPANASPPRQAFAAGPSPPQPVSHGLSGSGHAYYQPYQTEYTPMPVTDLDASDEMSEVGKHRYNDTDQNGVGSAFWSPGSSALARSAPDLFGHGPAAVDSWDQPEPKRTRCSSALVLSVVGAVLLALAVGIGAGVGVAQRNKKSAAASSSASRLSSEVSAASSLADAQGFKSYSLLTVTLSDAVVTLSRAVAAVSSGTQSAADSATLTTGGSAIAVATSAATSASPASSATTVSATSAASSDPAILSASSVATPASSSTSDPSPSSELSSEAETESSVAQPTTSPVSTPSFQSSVASASKPSAASTAASQPAQTNAATDDTAPSSTPAQSEAAGQ